MLSCSSQHGCTVTLNQRKLFQDWHRGCEQHQSVGINTGICDRTQMAVFTLTVAPVMHDVLTPALFSTTRSGGVSVHAYVDPLHTALEGASCRGLQR